MFPTCKIVCSLPRCPYHPELPHCQCGQFLEEGWNLKYVLVSLKIFGDKNDMFLSLGFVFFFFFFFLFTKGEGGRGDTRLIQKPAQRRLFS